MFGLPVFNKAPAPAIQVAAREKAFDELVEALAVATKAAAAARALFEREIAECAGAERELAALARPGVEDAAIEAYQKREATLKFKIEAYRPRIADAEERTRICEVDVAQAREALAAAIEELDAPARDGVEDVSRLKNEADRARVKLEAASAAVAKAERGGAAALAAFEAVRSVGASREEASQIREARKRARADIASAAAEHAACAKVERAASQRLFALQEALDRETRRAEFDGRLARLTSQRAELALAIETADAVGGELGSLVRTWREWMNRYAKAQSYANGFHFEQPQLLMTAPHFEQAARVPVLRRPSSCFVSSHWEHDYSQFELRDDILRPLLKSLDEAANDPERRAVLKSSGAVFGTEYVRLGRRYLECLAILHSWRASRDELFADASDLTAGAARPSFPLVTLRGDDELLPWKRLNLPALRTGGEPIWHPEWAAQKLLELTSFRSDVSATSSAPVEPTRDSSDERLLLARRAANVADFNFAQTHQFADR